MLGPHLASVIPYDIDWVLPHASTFPTSPRVPNPPSPLRTWTPREDKHQVKTAGPGSSRA